MEESKNAAREPQGMAMLRDMKSLKNIHRKGRTGDLVKLPRYV
jgi:hypothetical protein